MKVDRSEFEANLPKKGFQEERDSHHIFFHHYFEGKRTAAYTKISHSARMREVSGDLLKVIRKQLQLDTTREAVDLIKCPMTAEQFLERLKQKGVIKPGR